MNPSTSMFQQKPIKSTMTQKIKQEKVLYGVLNEIVDGANKTRKIAKENSHKTG